MGGISWPGSGVGKEKGVVSSSIVHHKSCWYKLLAQISVFFRQTNILRVPDCCCVFEVGANI